MMTTIERKKEFQFTQAHFDQLRSQAKEYTGISANTDKFEMYYARLAKRLRKLGLRDFDSYIQRISADAIEFKEFINSITTNVTSFDREAYHFEFLKEQIKAGSISQLSIWSAGCSTGEEPYSLIINLYDLCKSHRLPLRILATDLDTNVLRTASQGVYPIKAIDNYSQTIKRQFFQKGTGSNAGKARVKQAFRNMIEFKQLNLIETWRFNKPFDVIFCRNVMIYFENDMKQHILKRYAQNLKPHGLMFLGHSESVPKNNPDFDNVGKTIYQKR